MSDRDLDWGDLDDDEAAWRASESAAAEADAEAANEAAQTSEQDHTHVCPRCGDSWLHADNECLEPSTPLPAIWIRSAWAICPQCQEG